MKGYTTPYIDLVVPAQPEWIVHTVSILFIVGIFLICVAFFVSNKKVLPATLGITGIILMGFSVLPAAAGTGQINAHYAKTTQEISEGIEKYYNVTEFTPRPTLNCRPNGSTGTDQATWITPQGERVAGEFKVLYYGESCNFTLLNVNNETIDPYVVKEPSKKHTV